MRVDCLMVGQGLAGSILAEMLAERGRTVLVVDDGHRSSSSKVAAGMVNPLAGLRFSPPPNAEETLTEAETFYRRFEESAGERLYFPRRVRRIFRSAEEAARWQKVRETPPRQPFVADEIAPGGPDAPHGGVLIQGGAYLEVARFLELARQRLRESGALCEEPFSYEKLRLSPGTAHYGEIAATQVIFCEGWKVRENPWFGDFPWDPVKGEILTFRAEHGPPDARPQEVFNRGHWILPTEGGLCKVGATYERRQIDQQPTENARAELETFFRESAGVATLLRHEAGIRPATKNSQPIVQAHPECSQLWCFNGFGSKGTMLIPRAARRLAASRRLGPSLPTGAIDQVGRAR